MHIRYASVWNKAIGQVIPGQVYCSHLHHEARRGFHQASGTQPGSASSNICYHFLGKTHLGSKKDA